MNHTYRLIWSRRSHCFVAVGEHAQGCGKSARGAALVIAAALTAAILPASPVSAGPTGGAIINGIAGDSITRPNPTTTVINQASPRLAINWTSFSSAEGEKIQFVQPNASAIALNRVTSRIPSELLGNLTANGQVFVINPNGVLFGAKASVNVGGLLASSLDMKSDSFLNGSQVMEGGDVGAVVNKGTLTANPGGYVVLAGPRLTNEGAISAVQGKVLMAAGDKVTVTLNNASLASYTIDRNSLNALVQNSGSISASAGEVTLDARAVNDIGRAVINHTGVIEAKSLQGTPGKIRLLGTGESDLLVNGKLDASASAGQDGFVETNAARVNIGEKALINGKTPDDTKLDGIWTNNSRDFVIAEGKGLQTSSSIGADTLSEKLREKAQILATPNVNNGKGSFYVNAPVVWDAANSLSLQASQSIFFNANIKATKGKLELRYNQSNINSKNSYYLGKGVTISLPAGENFTLYASEIFPDPIKYTVITDVGVPQDIRGNSLQSLSNGVNSGRYVLGADIDASVTKDWNKGAGFVPIGGFAGILDGLGHTVSNLFINSTQSLWVGLIRDLTSTGRIQNLTLERANVSNKGTSPTTAVGTVVGKNDGTLFNVHATTNVVTTYNNAGGLVGINNGEIRNSSAVGTVTFQGSNDAEATGGLVGRQVGQAKTGGTSKVGGTIIDSYAMVNVIGNRSVGGLVGLMEKSATDIENPTVTGSYAGVSADGSKGSVQGKENVGGLVGYLELGGIKESYATVPVTGTAASSAAIGGLVGLLGGSVERAYASGPVTSKNADKSTVGGLIGNVVTKDRPTIPTALNSFWNTETTGQAASRGGTSAKGITTAEMRNLSTFVAAGWGIDAEGGTGKIWRIYDRQTAPLLRSFLVTKNVEDKSVTYNNKLQIGCTGTPCDGDSGSPTFSAASGKTAGTYTPYDLQQGYDIRGGRLTITPLLLTPTTNAPEKVYDRTANVSQQLPLYLPTLDNDDVTVTYAAARYDNKNVGDNKTVTFFGIALGGGNAGNYEIPDTIGFNNGRITPLTLSLLGTAIDNKVYDGSTAAKVSKVGTLEKAIQGDDISVSAGSAEFSDKNVAQKKVVTVRGLTLAGADAGNYLLDSTTVTANADITPLTLSLSGTTAASKVYDGNKFADVLNQGTLDKVVAGDTVIVNVGAAEFSDKNVGQKKTVTVSGLTLSGKDAGNYLLDSKTATTVADITPLTLSLSGTAVASKVYDGGKVASISNAGTLDKAVKGDDVGVTADSAEFNDKNVAQRKTVTVSGLKLAGKDAGNYLLDRTTAATVADITPLTLALSGTAVASKIYDGKTATTLTNAGTLAKGIGNDVVTLDATGASAAFADKNVGKDKAVTVSGLALQGADAGNYRIDNPSAKASIAARALSLSQTEVADKVYDGSTVATLTNAGTLKEVVANDDVKTTTASVTAAFADRNAGQGKTVTVSNLALTGADAANYVLDSTQTATATIRPRALAVRAQGVDKVYDGNTNANVTLGDNRLGGDKLDLRYARASFADSNAGSGKTVTVAGIAAAGADAGNYVADASAVTTASISKAPLVITANPDGKAFDGKAYRGGNGVAYAGFVAGENAAVLSGQPSYGGDAQGAVNVGTYRIAPGGYASRNYAIVYVDGKLTIQQPPLEPVYQAAGTEVAATAAAVSGAASNLDSMRLLSQQATLQVAGCGARLPERPLAVAVDCSEGRASGSARSMSGF
ncbi:YDG domain-containing protein [Noviherbaspirillum sp. 1P10PC]|uniref:YDG domain-containing protein n=1 Tax=Noviherbaspirillum sp. 1P10PC TaxID=3132292 RepID=UPI0039A37B1B